ncbi:MAG: ATP-dependent zinc metalloprotease FtsH [Phycisphaeraceae bacterium]|nr:ATP-dependent zinc metalloprotease FtsH [Phycisphaeraceae bacterium]MCW5762691.1 ATP-dependent zinc metalloprotease FtsH [Phycisphaeraceae bacterium]
MMRHRKKISSNPRFKLDMAGGEPSKGGDGPVQSGGNGPKDPKAPTTATGPSRNGLFGFITVILLIVMLVMFFSQSQSGNRISIQELVAHIESGDLVPNTQIIVRDDAIIAEINQPESRTSRQTVTVAMNSATKELTVGKLDEALLKKNLTYISKPQSAMLQLLLFFGPILLIMIVIWVLISRGLRGAASGGGMLGNFGKSRHQRLTKEMTGVTFKDVAGIDEAKDEVREIIEFLKNPKKFTRLGGRIPRGVLLIGDPGCGKTLLAKAIAGEADVPFFTISGSDFVEMFVGVGASRVRDLFKQAKDSAPCIIFLDEIDAVGRRRGGGFSSGGNDEREQTLNAILVEMDGFSSSDGVIVIAATNRGDVLDPALTRPGRFDRQITVPLPDLKGRLEILTVHAKKVKMGPDVDLERVARGTPMFSGADLAAIINESAIAATMQNKDFIEHEDLEEARDKVKFGRSARSRMRDREENRATAYHEAGHAVLQALLSDADPLHKVTIIPRGQSLGATFSLPEKDRLGYSKRWLLATQRVMCGGRIAEEKATGDVTSGASQDIAQVTQLARTMVLDWGMSDRLGFVRYAPLDSREMFLPERDYSDDTAKAIDQEVRKLIDEAYEDARRLIEANWDKVVAVAESLLKHETLSSDEVERLMRGERLNKPSVVELLEAEQKRKAALTTPKPETPSDDGEPDFPFVPSPA